LQADSRVPVSEPYRGGPADRPAMSRDEMTDSPQKTVAAIIRAGDSDEPPRRLVLGSDAWQLLTEALTRRLDEIEPQRKNAATADIN
jgi:hypothetical protein